MRASDAHPPYHREQCDGHQRYWRASKHTGGVQTLGASNHTEGCPNIQGACRHTGGVQIYEGIQTWGHLNILDGIQTYGASKCMGAYGHPHSLTKHAFFVLCMYRGHPNIIQADGGIQTYGMSKHMGHADIQGVSKHVRASKHGGI